MFKKLTESFRTKASSKDSLKAESVPEEAKSSEEIKSSEEVKSTEPQEVGEDKSEEGSPIRSSILRSKKTMKVSKVKKGLGKGLGDSIGASLTSGIKKSGKAKSGIE